MAARAAARAIAAATGCRALTARLLISSTCADNISSRALHHVPHVWLGGSAGGHSRYTPWGRNSDCFS